MKLDELAALLVQMPKPAERRAWLAAHRPADPAALVQAIKSYGDQFLFSDPARALNVAVIAQDVAGSLVDPLAQAWADWALGNAQIYSGEYGACLARYGAAAAVFSARALPLEAARLRANMVFALTNLGRYAEALTLADATRTELEPYGPTRFLATLEQNTGIALRHLGRYQEALAVYARAHTLFANLGDPVKTAEMDVNRAKVLENLDDFVQAEALLNAARPVFVEHGQALTLARLDLNLGTLLARQGRYQAALDNYADARAGFAALQNEMEVAVVDFYRASVYLALNLAREAHALATAALPVLAAHQMVREVTLCREQQAAARSIQGAFAEASELYREAHDAWLTLAAPTEAARLALAQAALLRVQGRPADAIALLLPALAIFAQERMVIRQAQAQIEVGDCAFALARWDDASIAYRAAGEHLEGAGILALNSRVHFGVGRLACQQGEWARGAVQLGRAVDALERLQHTLLPDEFQRSFLDDKQEVFAAYVLALLHLGELEKAVAVIDRAKSAVLLDFLAEASSSPPAQLDAAEQALWRRLQELSAAWHWHFGQTDDPALDADQPDRDEGALRIVLQRVEQESLDLWWTLQRRGVVHPAARPLHLAELQQALPEDAALLDYYAIDQRLLCCVIGRERVDVIDAFPAALAGVARSLTVLGMTLRSAGAMAPAYQSAVLEPATRAHLHWLYQTLLAPVAARLAGCRRLIIAPFGPLHYAPFHACFDGERYALERWEMSYTPAASLILRQSELAAAVRFDSPLSGRAVVLGNSAGGRLPFVVREAQQVAAQLPDALLLVEEAATTAAVRTHAPGCSLLHLAAHGVFRSDNPLFSHLHLADAPLRLLDLYGLRLHDPLVVLSACETGVGQARGGDWVGLCRGFMGAGARALVASLWRVDDAATAALMADFYHNLAAGQTPAAALRGAQLAMLAQRSHPYFWAPFVFVGAPA